MWWTLLPALAQVLSGIGQGFNAYNYNRQYQNQPYSRIDTNNGAFYQATQSPYNPYPINRYGMRYGGYGGYGSYGGYGGYGYRRMYNGRRGYRSNRRRYGSYTTHADYY